jgi:hypothetical protein
MKTCEQMPGMTILEHGESVARTYKAMFIERTTGYMPEIIRENLEFLLEQTCTAEETGYETYHVFHDCGKPDCLKFDDEGRRHFPNHAMMSARAWLAAGGDTYIGRLIEHDMDMHTLKPADVPLYKHLDIAPVLLLTAWAELNANCIMFGGTDSTSFKIKAKNLTKLSRAIIHTLKEQS